MLQLYFAASAGHVPLDEVFSITGELALRTARWHDAVNIDRELGALDLGLADFRVALLG